MLATLSQVSTDLRPRALIEVAVGHPAFGPIWRAAFAYYDPKERLDVSDTGELMYILELGEIGIEAFQERFLKP